MRADARWDVSGRVHTHTRARALQTFFFFFLLTRCYFCDTLDNDDYQNGHDCTRIQ